MLSFKYPLKIWERYFLREMTKIFALFLITFYGLYVLIDYSNHSRSFQHYHFTFFKIASFYAYEFITRMDVLVPFAVLLACIKTLCTLNTRNELIALRISGVKLKRLLLPFILFGLLFTAVLYINAEFLLPNAMKFHKQLDHTRAKEKQKKNHHPFIQQIVLEDHSSLIFQSYDNNQNRFFDAVWVRSIDDIYRMRYLFPYAEKPTATSVEHLQRDANGFLTITEMFNEKEFSDMHFNKEALLETLTSLSGQSLSELGSKLTPKRKAISEKEARLFTTFYHKLAMPWLCLLVIIACAPFCTRFSRTLPVFLIFALGVFGLIAFNLFMDAAVILAERQMLAPELAIGVPFICCFAFFGWRFMRL